jgi:tetratricopeptide (TPR) repeat protein
MDPHRKLLAIALLASLVAVPTALSAQEWAGRGRISGVVTDEAEQPMAGATVTLRKGGAEGAGPKPIATDAKGRWTILGLGGGEWTVLIEAEGYNLSEGEVHVSEYGPGQTVRVQLRPLSQEQIQEARGGDHVIQTVEEGNRLLEAGDHAGARARYQAALAELDREHHPALLRGVARTHYQEGQAEQAIAVLHQALEIAPDDPETLQLLVNLLVAEGREEEAQPLMARLPEGAKLDPDALLNLGIQHYNSGEMERALPYFQQVVDEHPELADGYYYRGLVFLSQGENARARADLEKLLELAPDHERATEAREFLQYLE